MRLIGEKLHTRLYEIGDTCGFYDQFTAQEAIFWNNQVKPQRVRDALREMVKRGCLIRVSTGTYRWTTP